MTSIPRRPAGVAIDGDRVRQIREEQELTQLYIAEVVGVSVDTVSRWENKRTQAIRADNLRALAAALEVAVEEITLAEAAPGVPPPGRWRRWAVLAAMLAGAVAAGTAWWQWGGNRPELVALRRLPAYTAPGTAVPVVVTAQVLAGEVHRVVLREQLPPGWQFVGAVPPPDQGPDDSGRLRWIVPVGGGRAAVAYVVRAPPGAPESSAHRFSGEVVTAGKEGRSVAVKGETRIDLEYIYWADEDGDFQVGDGEVLDALERIEAVPDLGIDSSDLRTLWGEDEYEWDLEAGAVRVVPAPKTGGRQASDRTEKP
jgi:transcriptional regulator with XRE-family HTH domain